MSRIFLVLLGVVILGMRGAVQAPFVTTLAVPDRANATPSIAADGSRVAVAWSAREASGKTDIYVATSGDGGRTFAEPVRVNDEPGTARVGGEMPPRVALSGRAIDVLWTSRGTATTIRVARSDDGGRTFGASRELQRGGAPGDRGWPAISVDERERLHAIWLDHRGLAEAGGSRHVHGGAVDAAEKRDGVAIAQKSGLYYAGSQGEREIAKGVCYCCKTALASTPNGRIFAAWRHVFAGNIRDIAFTSSRDGGRTFAPFVRVSQDNWQLDGCPDDGPSLAVDEHGAAHLVWPAVVSEPEPHKAIFYASTRNGRTFTPRVRVSEAGQNGAHPQIALDPLGQVFVVWDGIVAGQRRLFISERGRFAKGAFRPPVAIGSPDPAWYPAVTRSTDSILIAATEGTSSRSVIRVHQLWYPQ
jgi:hypothetical protein